MTIADQVEAQKQRYRLEDRTAEFLLQWQMWRDERTMPAKADVDPLAIGARLLPYLYLVEVLADGFRYRLVGTAGVEAAGRELTGLPLGKATGNPRYCNYLRDLFRLVSAERCPVLSETNYRQGDFLVGSSQRLMCPLSSDGETVDFIIGAQSDRLSAGRRISGMNAEVEAFEEVRTELVAAAR